MLGDMFGDCAWRLRVETPAGDFGWRPRLETFAETFVKTLVETFPKASGGVKVLSVIFSCSVSAARPPTLSVGIEISGQFHPSVAAERGAQTVWGSASEPPGAAARKHQNHPSLAVECGAPARAPPPWAMNRSLPGLSPGNICVYRPRPPQKWHLFTE